MCRLVRLGSVETKGTDVRIQELTARKVFIAADGGQGVGRFLGKGGSLSWGNTPMMG